jgi:predicted RNA-binding protein
MSNPPQWCYRRKCENESIRSCKLHIEKIRARVLVILREYFCEDRIFPLMSVLTKDADPLKAEGCFGADDVIIIQFGNFSEN